MAGLSLGLGLGLTRGGGVSLATISAPTLTVTDWSTYPPPLEVALDETVFEDDVLQVQADDDPRFASTSIDEDVVLDAAAISTGAITVPGVSSISSPAVTYFRARVKRGAAISAWSDVIIHGEATDNTPAAFTFTDVTGANLSTVYESNTITLSGFNVPVAMSITGGEYAVDSGSGFGAYTSEAGLAYPSDDVKVRATSSASEETAASVVLTIGGVSDTYTVTTGDFTAPVLSAPTDTATGASTMSGTVTTDEEDGTLYWYISTSATPPSAADLKAGTGAVVADSQAVSAAGVQNIIDGGLTAETTYYTHYLHSDPSGNDSNIVTASGFTTEAPSAVTAEGTAAPAQVNVGYASSSYTFASQAIGTPSANRVVVVRTAIFDNSLVSVTIGGVSATKLADAGVIELWAATVPTGTTADIVLNNGSLIGLTSIVVGAVYDASLTPTDTQVLAYGFRNDPQSVSVTTPTDGVTIVAGYVQSPNAVGTWSNTFSTSAAIVSADNTAHWTYRDTAGAATVSVTGWGNKNSALVAASFEPV